MQHYKFFAKARQASLLSTHKFRVGACLVISNSIFIGFNKADVTDPKGNTKFNSIHAELDVLRKAGIHRDFSKAKLYIYRAMKNPLFGIAGLAKPCDGCQILLKDKGIKEYYYSIDDHTFGCFNNKLITRE